MDFFELEVLLVLLRDWVIDSLVSWFEFFGELFVCNISCLFNNVLIVFVSSNK